MGKTGTYKKYITTTTGVTLVGVFSKSDDKLIQWLSKNGSASRGRKIRKADDHRYDILSSDTIPYPKRQSEFEIQSHIFQHLLKLGYDVRGSLTSRRRFSRLDLVIFEQHKPVLIIEVKKPGQYMTQTQRDKYETYGIPLEVVRSIREANSLVKRFSTKGALTKVNRRVE